MQPKEFTGFCQHECCWFLSTSPNLTREELRRKWAKLDSVNELRHCRGGVFVPIEYEGRQVLTCYQGLEALTAHLPRIPSNKKLVLVFVLTVLRDIWCMVLRPRHLRVGLKGNPPFLNEDIFSLAGTSFPRKLPKFQQMKICWLSVSVQVETDSSFWMIEDGTSAILFHQFFLQRRFDRQTRTHPSATELQKAIKKKKSRSSQNRHASKFH